MYKHQLRGVPVLELPAKAADLVKQAKVADRKNVTIAVVAAVSQMKPAAVPAVVGTIARTQPQYAATAAATAAAFQPGLASELVRASATVVPEQISAIVTEVCRVAPYQFQAIALAGAEAVPNANARIVTAVASAIPALKSPIEQAQKTPDMTVDAVMTGALQIAGPTLTLAAAPEPALKAATAGSTLEAAAASGSSAAPVVNPPFKTLPGTPGEVTPSDTYQKPEGPRKYSAP